MPGRLGMGLECFLGLGCLRTIGWLVVELFCFLGGGGGVGGGGYLECKRFLGLYNPLLGGLEDWLLGWRGFCGTFFDWIG